MASITFTDSIDGSLTVAAGLIEPNAPSNTPADDVVLQVNAVGRLIVPVPAPTRPPLSRRVRPAVSFTVDRPAILAGRPVTPQYWAQLSPGGSLTQDATHAHVVNDPDPNWDPVAHAWIMPPPTTAKDKFVRWTARDLPDPSSFADGTYLLGAPSSVDGTSGIAAACQNWPSSAGSSLAINWNSAYPFKPVVAPYTHHGNDGSVVTVPTCVHFSPHHVAHLWADLGTLLTPPFTIVLAAIVTHMPTKNYIHTLIDSGKDPTTAVSTTQRTAWWKSGVTGTTALGESMSYRTAMQVQARSERCFNDVSPSTRIARPAHALTRRPKVYYGIWNGTSSKFGNYSTSGKSEATARLSSHGAQQYAVLGRANNRLSQEEASVMVLLEVRMWNQALTDAEIKGEYDQLSSTWRFHAYR